MIRTHRRSFCFWTDTEYQVFAFQLVNDKTLTKYDNVILSDILASASLVACGMYVLKFPLPTCTPLNKVPCRSKLYKQFAVWKVYHRMKHQCSNWLASARTDHSEHAQKHPNTVQAAHWRRHMSRKPLSPEIVVLLIKRSLER